MNKIIVIGTTGSGKSTFAAQLSKKLNIPHVQLDSLFWKPNWIQSTDEEFFNKIKVATDGPCWVVDGNYERTNHLTWKAADTVIWIDFSFKRTFYQIMKRSLIRAISRKELWKDTGNRESFFRLFSKESIFLWFFKTYARNVKRYELRTNDSNYKHLSFYRFKSPKEVNEFLQTIS